MKQCCLLIIAVITGLAAYGQKEGNIWYFGYNAGLDFNTSPPTPLNDGAMQTREGCATFCDVNGKLLFYSDGISVWNRKHNKMPNGTGLQGNASSTQSCIVVADPGNVNKYYIFTVVNEGLPAGCQYSVIDMTMDGGYGDVTSSKNLKLLAPCCEKLTAVKHANGTDTWILIHNWQGNSFYAYLLTANGVQSPVVSATGTNYKGFTQNTLGCLTVSPDGSKVASVNYGQRLIDLLDFNNATGVLTYSVGINFGLLGSPYGASFSPDNSLLYAALYAGNSGSHGIYQYDAGQKDSVSLAKSAYFIDAGFPVAYGTVQIGPDGKIYIAQDNQSSLSVISYPNKRGSACTFIANGVTFNNVKSGLGLPDMVQSLFLPEGFSVSIGCPGTQTSFTADESNVDSSVWDFGDIGSGTADRSKQLNPIHTFQSPGKYLVILKQYVKGHAFSVSKSITIPAYPKVDSLITQVLLCPGAKKMVGFKDTSYIYKWWDGTAQMTHEVSSAGHYTVTILNGACSITDSFKVVYEPVPSAEFRDTAFCSGDTLRLTERQRDCSYKWADSSADRVKVITRPGQFSVQISNGKCAITDNFKVAEKAVPPPVHYDTTKCPGRIVIFDYRADSAGNIFTWQNGSHQASFSTFDTGTYSVIIGSGGCHVKNTFTVHDLPAVYPLHWRDTVLCTGTVLELGDTQADVYYLWQDSFTKPRRPITTSGYYTLTKYNRCDTVKSSIKILYLQKPFLPIWKDTTLCHRQVLALQINTFGGKYTWSDGYKDTMRTIVKPGLYAVSVSNICGRADGMINAGFHDCPFTLYIPNAFSPGDDRLNDIFKPVMDYAPTTYSFSVYNRWGERIFITDDWSSGWDGTFHNQPAPEGAYVYVVNATSWLGDTSDYRSGIFYLFRK